MEKWSAEQLPALVSGFSINCSLLFHSLPVYCCLQVFSTLLICLSFSLSFSVFYSVCVSQWTVAGAAGPRGALAVEHVMLGWEGGIVQEPILLQPSGVVPAKETQLGSIPAALNPALVRRSTWLLILLYTVSMFWKVKDELPVYFTPVCVQRH